MISLAGYANVEEMEQKYCHADLQDFNRHFTFLNH